MLPALSGNGGGADQVARENIMLNAFRIAVNGGLSVQNMVDGVVDELTDETGVDTVTSINETYDATGNFYSGSPGSYAANFLDGTTTVTSNLGSYSGTPANVVDGSTITYWQGNGSITTGDYLQFDLGSGVAKKPGKLRWFTDTTSSDVFQNWVLKASNTGAFNSEDVTLATGTASLTPGGAWQEVTFTAPTTAYRYFRYESADGTKIGGNSVYDPTYKEFEMMEVSGTLNMTLVSTASTALAEPTGSTTILWQEDVDAVILNTDLTAYASRDGGSTWTQVILAQEAILGNGRILAGSTNIAAQPAGTSMKWKIETLNNKNQKIHAIGLEWS